MARVHVVRAAKATDTESCRVVLFDVQTGVLGCTDTTQQLRPCLPISKLLQATLQR